MGIESWSTTAASNNSASPNGAPEGMAPSGVNDTIRQNMASVRSWFQDAEWINLGYTHTYASSTSVTVSGTDVTADYPAGRRIRAVGSSTGTIYGVVASSSFSTNTTINFTWDSGSLSNESLTISASIIKNGSTGQSFVLADNAVTTAKIADGAVTNAKLADGYIDSLTAVTMASGDYIAIADTSDSNKKKKALASDLATLLFANTRFNIGTITRDMTAATGSVAYTGVGFTPAAIIFIGGIAGLDSHTWGFSTGSGANRSTNIYPGGSGALIVQGTFAAVIYEDVGKYQSFAVTSMDADGFTGTWTKGSTPAANTGTLYYLAFR